MKNFKESKHLILVYNMKTILYITLYIISSNLAFAGTDSIPISSNDSSINSSGELINSEKNIQTDNDSIFLMSENNLKHLENLLLEKSIWNTTCGTILIGLIVSILASILVLSGDRFCEEMKMKKTFKYLEGKYIHTGEGVRPNCFSTLIYHKGGKFVISTTTANGNWNGRIVMDRDLTHYGGGIFNYEGKKEGGLLNIIVKDITHIYVFPSTLTHEVQRINFYILEKI